ncbi:MAG: A/G-specific adenine glycosylase [Candidatus Paceibacteria bacterium]|jgi:A/G-specific adenine glycosylase
MPVKPLNSAKIQRMHRALLGWFEREQRALPWRENRDPYRVWVSEAMLQQTRVETVIGYFERFLDRFPTLADLASAEEEAVLGMWSGLGYYSRARKLHAAAKEIVKRFGGEFPRTRADALSLPGIGPYTAGAVLSIAHGMSEPLVDGNVQRVFARLFALRAEAGCAALQKDLWDLAGQLVPQDDRAGDWNQSLMELGATCCVARSPDCNSCPVSSECRARELEIVSELPTPKPRRAPTRVELEIFVVARGPDVLLEQRPREGRMGGLWQFPTVESAPGDALFPATLPAEPGLFRPGPIIGELRHSITRYAIHAQLRTAELAGDPPAGWKWFQPADLEGAALTGMTKKALLVRVKDSKMTSPVGFEQRGR